MLLTMMRDERPVLEIWHTSGEYGFSTSPDNKCANPCHRIEVYGEQGEMSLVPWIAIYESESAILPSRRFAARDFEIRYKSTP